MATGIEVVGLTLAVLPLLINQVDGYVQGCERLKLLNDRKYFHQHKRWKLQLETEQIFLNNALETILYDEVVRSKVKLFFENPRPESRAWDKVVLETALQSRLGPLYVNFKNNLSEVEFALGVVCKKLDIDPRCPQAVDWTQVGTLKILFQKLRTLFKQSIYQDLLSTLRSANATLRDLVDVARDTQKRKISFGQSLRFRALRKARDCAVSLYRELVGGQHWPCAQTGAHSFAYLLPVPEGPIDEEEQLMAQLCVGGRCRAASSKPDVWINAQSIPTGVTTPMRSISGNAQTILSSQPPIDGKKKGKGVSFGLRKKDPHSDPHTGSKQPQPPKFPISAAIQSPVTSKKLADLCLWVEKAHIVDPNLSHVLELRDAKGEWNHTLKGAESRVQPELYSLEHILTSSCDFMTSKTPKGTFVFRKNQRLQVAATLTLAAFLFQDNWLAHRWHAGDIQIEVSRGSDNVVGVNPQKSFTVSQMKEIRSKEKDPTSVTSSTLLSVGCALVQLSLRQTLEERRQDDERRPSQAETDLLTARNALYDVQGHSDKAYYDVARACLYWDETNNEGLDDEEFSREVFERIVAPMLDLWHSSKS